MSTNIAELTPDGKEQVGLLPEWSGIILIDFHFLGTHIRISDLRHRSQEEQDNEETNETSNTKISPLHVSQSLGRINSVSKEDSASQKRRNERTDSLHGLRQVQSNLRVSRRTADGEERISCCLERGEPGSDNEHAAAETAEGVLDSAGPHEETADREDEQTDHEGDAETPFAEDPAGDGGGTEEVGAEVGGGETGGFGGCDFEGCLEMGVKDIEETVCETPRN